MFHFGQEYPEVFMLRIQFVPHPVLDAIEGIKEAVKVQGEPSVSHMRNWLDCMRSRAVTNAPIEVGYRHSVASIMGYQALRAGKKLKYLPESRKIVEA